MKKAIYADNAATTRLDPDAYCIMTTYLLEHYGNASQPYSFARQPKKALADARALIADCLGAEADEIYFTSGGTEGDNWAIKGMLDYGKKKVTITSQIEHHAVLNACAAAERAGYPVVYLPVDPKGVVSPSALEHAFTKQVNLVSIMLANNEIGTIEPVSELAKIAHKYGAAFHTDAVQAVGHTPINVKQLGIDILSASAHKFNGPKGIGFQYIKKGTPLIPYTDGGAQEFSMRAGTENIAGIAAMAVALKKNCEEMETTAKRLSKMEGVFIQRLRDAQIPFLRNGSSNRLPGNINISIKDISGEMLLHRLDLKKIYISTGSACDSVNTQISHVIKAVKVPQEYANGTIRITFGKNNDFEDALTVANAIIDIIKN